MNSMKTVQDDNEKPSAIICIAYHQLSLMCGIANPFDRPPAIEDAVSKGTQNELTFSTELPMIGTILTQFRQGYVQIKESNDFFTTVLSGVEDLFFKGAQYVEPIKEKVTNAIEAPRQSVDSAICVGRDYFGEKVSGIDLTPATQIVENIQSYFRNYVIQPMKCLIAALKDFGLKQEEGNRKDLSEKSAKDKD